jgi:hypothetical protein
MLTANPVLMATSLTFLMPMLAALHSDSLLAAIVCGNMAVTSFIYHWFKDPTYFWIDQIAIVLYMIAGVYEAFFKKQTFHQIVVGAICLYTTCLHHFGYAYTCYIWDDDCSVATQHHAGMHFVSAIAATLIFLRSKTDLDSHTDRHHGLST